MIVIRKHLPRRTFLRGVGVCLALPLLDAHVPAFASSRQAVSSKRRFGAVYAPNGFIEDAWTPASVGSAFELPPILQPLKAFRDRMVVITGLGNKPADALPGEGSGDHARAGASWLSGVHVKKTEGTPEGGVTIDQILARDIGQRTQLPSLELSLESRELVGACDLGYSCAYTGAISWRNPSMPLLPEHNPRVVFERLFGATDSTDPAARAARLRQNRSILDAVRDKVARLERGLGPEDTTKLTEYLDAVRDVEHRLQKAESQSALDLEHLERPAGVPEAFDDYARLMFDLLVLSLQVDLTRVFTFMLGGELSSRTYPQIGVPDAHHAISHHQYDPDKVAKCAKVNAYHCELFSYLLEKLRSTREADGLLLDSVTLLYGTGLGNSDRHTHFDLGTLLISSGADGFTGGRHVRYPKDTPLSNLHLSILTKMGIRPERVGDSTGTLTDLSGV